MAKNDEEATVNLVVNDKVPSDLPIESMPVPRQRKSYHVMSQSISATPVDYKVHDRWRWGIASVWEREMAGNCVIVYLTSYHTPRLQPMISDSGDQRANAVYKGCEVSIFNNDVASRT